jgi:hypothetical protein
VSRSQDVVALRGERYEMRATTLIPFTILLMSCTPESHVLLSGSGGDDAGGGGGNSWTDCQDALEGGGETGDECSFGGGCSTDLPPGGARCLRGELLIATAATEGAVEGDCTADVIETNGTSFARTDRAGPGCFTGRTCSSSRGTTFTFCQTGAPRAEARDEASAGFWVDCLEAVDRGRDGNGCVGDFICHDTVDGHGVIGWCDDGILRLSTDYPFYHL